MRVAHNCAVNVQLELIGTFPQYVMVTGELGVSLRDNTRGSVDIVGLTQVEARGIALLAYSPSNQELRP